MFVRDRMSSPAITITPDTPFQDALRLMHDHSFRRLPVVDRNDKLIGIVSERDLLYVSPSKATSLNVWELHYLLSKVKIRDIMTTDVISTTCDTPIEDAAHMMAAEKIGGLPVIDEENRVVGVITETDIFKAFDELFAGGEFGLRLTLKVPDKKGVLASLCQAIYELGGSVVGVGSFNCGEPDERGLVVKVRDVGKDQLVDTLEVLGDRVVDAREV